MIAAPPRVEANRWTRRQREQGIDLFKVPFQDPDTLEDVGRHLPSMQASCRFRIAGGLGPIEKRALAEAILEEWDGSFEPSIAGIFAGGGARRGSTKQAASDAGEGTGTALMIRAFLQMTRV